MLTGFLFFVGIAAGIFIGYTYATLKYRLPEFQEMIRFKAARLKEERLLSEVNSERYQSAIDDEIDRRMKGYEDDYEV